MISSSRANTETYQIYIQKTHLLLFKHSPAQKHPSKSLTSEQSRKYQQPKSHRLPHAAFLNMSTERLAGGEIEMEGNKW